MTASLLRCPNGCVGELSVQEKERQGDRLIHGILVCPTCGSNYPVAEGIAPVGVGKPGEPCVTVEFGGKTETIPFGEIRVYPLGFQNGAEGEPESAEIVVTPTRNFDLGEGKGREIRRTVQGGVVGVIVDARGRPLQLPAEPTTRLSRLQEWLRALNLPVAE